VYVLVFSASLVYCIYVVSALVNPTLIPIPYRIYQPKRAGNLPIPANPPVNEWDATLKIMDVKINMTFLFDEMQASQVVYGGTVFFLCNHHGFMIQYSN